MSSAGAAESSASAETLVRGAVPLGQLPAVISTVKLLCPDSGHLGKFRDHDRVYNVGPDVRAPKAAVRLREHLENPPAEPPRPSWAPYSLMYYGLIDRRVPAPVEKRPVQTVPVGPEGPELVATLSCIPVHEYVRRGARFRTRAGLVIELYIAEKVPDARDADAQMTDAARGEDESEEKLAIVQVSSDRGAAPEDLLAFINYLAPLGVVVRR
jgi:hypothetical protein